MRIIKIQINLVTSEEGAPPLSISNDAVISIIRARLCLSCKPSVESSGISTVPSTHYAADIVASVGFCLRKTMALTGEKKGPLSQVSGEY